MSNRTAPLTEPLYDYLLDHSLREETATLSKRSMQIAPEQGQFRQVLARLIGRCRRVYQLQQPGDGRGASGEWDPAARHSR